MITSRTVTVLFTDQVGSTETISRLPTSEADRLRARHFGTVRSAIAVHHGQEVKNLGDGFMAVFDSATDGVACGITLQQAVLRDHLDGEPRMSMRVGLSAGEVSVEADDYFGVPVIEASRLCAAAEPDQILAAEVVGLLIGANGIHELKALEPMTLKGLPAPVRACSVSWEADGDTSLRIALADDAVLLRQGIASALQGEGFDVVLQAGDAESLLRELEGSLADVVIVDVRMPPTNTTEGLDAAERIRAEHPGTGVIVLSASVEATAASRLLSSGSDGIGYLLKDRVSDVAELAAAVRTVAAGGSAIDPEVVAGMVG